MPKNTREKNDPVEENEYFELQGLYDEVPPPADSFGASGLHYQLVFMLQQFGYSPRDKEDAYDMATNLLTTQWVENGHY